MGNNELRERAVTDEQLVESSARVRELCLYFKTLFPELQQVRVAVIGVPYHDQHTEINYWSGAKDDFTSVGSNETEYEARNA